jgi:hypothetical protein
MTLTRKTPASLVDHPYAASLRPLAPLDDLLSDSNATLKSRLDYLARYGGKKPDGTDKTRARLFKDGAPYSFSFVIEADDANGQWTTWFNGGLLYHGPHDGHGSGAAPTFAVSLTLTTGWSIHA